VKIGPEFELNRGKAEYKGGNFTEAINSFEKAIQLGVKSQDCCPELEDSYYKLARIFCKDASWKPAKKHIAKALQRNPGSLLYQRLSSILDKNINSSHDRSQLQGNLEHVKQIGSLIELENFNKKLYSPLISETYCVCAYRSGYDEESGNPLSRAIRRMKKEGSEELSPHLGRLMVAYLLSGTPLADFIDLIIPVPADPLRRKERGYHIVEDMSVPFENFLALPVFTNIIEKVKETPSLRGYNKYDREKILSGSFRIVESTLLRNRNILIIDEVLTHGTTIREVAKTIRNSNPKGIYALVFGKTERSKS